MNTGNPNRIQNHSLFVLIVVLVVVFHLEFLRIQMIRTSPHCTLQSSKAHWLMADIVGLFEGFKIPANAQFLIGVPSIGNVGQLAMDCILCTLNHSKTIKYIGCLESPYVLPMTGYERLGIAEKPKLCMPVEVYHILGKNLFIILQRSLCIKGTQKQFSVSLLKWLQSVKFDFAVVLTGANTEDIDLVKIFHASSPSTTLTNLENLFSDTLHLSASDSSNFRATQYPVLSSAVEIDDLMNLPRAALHPGVDSSLPLGMTTARYLLESSLVSSATSVEIDSANKTSDAGRVVVLGKFVSEGDNIGDGLELALRVLNGLNLAGQTEPLTVRALVHPESWSRRYGGGMRDTVMFN